MTAIAAKTADLISLVKPRIMVMALLTAAGAMSLAPGTIALPTALWLLAGTALIVGSANTLNMWLERDIDCLMARTKQRALPQQKITPNVALTFGALQGALSLPILGVVGIIPAALGLVALLLYVGAYTPMKQRTHWAVWVGGIPGAMPALMGWTAATRHIDAAGLAVFATLFIWQIPHTHAIGIYRKREYEAAGLKVLSSARGIAHTQLAIRAFLVIQILVSFLPAVLGVAGTPYVVTAALLGAAVLVQGFSPARAQVSAWARSVFLTSIVYLPILFAVMVASGRQ